MITALDAHAHVEPGIDARHLESLGACVLAVTRTLEEFKVAEKRRDRSVVWGAGCHPGLAKAFRVYSTAALERAIALTPVIGEIGLDRSSRVPIEEQVAVFNEILALASSVPRILSIHSYRATDLVLAALERYRPQGVVLHWWLGNGTETASALELGAYFSINPAQATRWDGLKLVPRSRILFETDHPFGDRHQEPPRRPGQVSAVEQRLAIHYKDSPSNLRRESWRNLNQLVGELGLHPMLPPAFQVQLLAS